jgi:hypothetical protein
MGATGVHLSVDDGITASDLRDQWSRLVTCRDDAWNAAAIMWQEWLDVSECDPGSLRSDELEAEYLALRRDYRVLAAWASVVYAAWVFVSEGHDLS